MYRIDLKIEIEDEDPRVEERAMNFIQREIDSLHHRINFWNIDGKNNNCPIKIQVSRLHPDWAMD